MCKNDYHDNSTFHIVALSKRDFITKVEIKEGIKFVSSCVNICQTRQKNTGMFLDTFYAVEEFGIK